MRNQRVRDLLDEIIQGHPEVTAVERVSLGNKGEVMRVKCVDGFEMDLLITTSSPPGGDDYSTAEKVVSKRE